MIRAMRRAKSFGWFLIVLMLWLYGGGRVHAENYAAKRGRLAPVAIGDSRFDSLLSGIKDLLSVEGPRTKLAPEKGFAGIRKLLELRESLAEENEKNLDYFSRLESFVTQKRLPAEILNRHHEFVREYTARYEALMANLEGIESAHNSATGFWAKLTGSRKKVDWDGVIGKAVSFLEANALRPRERHFDPKNLPHRSLKADKPIPPKLTREEWLQAYPTVAAGTGQPSVSSAAKANDSILLSATAPPAPADLAETIEVRFTPEIRQLADSLGKNPVKIYNWVRNNIEFVPTWGSIQGAQLCRESRIGNAFDTGSLLIALLRYSGIPARYQTGTIEVPIEQAKNWLGGFTEPRAAARFAASGGVPSAGTVEQGGVLRSIRMEHVWVKAYVDYVPSRGEISIQGDTWVDLDPSFKLYRHSPGADVAGALAFEVPVFRDHLLATTTFNASEVSITNIDHAFIRSAFNTSVTNLSNAFPGVDPRTLLPKRSAITRDLPVIATSNPYKVLVRGPAMATLPPELRHTMTVSVSDRTGGTSLSFSASLPEFATNNISLSFTYATQADIEFVRSVAPPDTFDPNTPGRGQRFLDSIPAHLVGVRPVIQLNGAAAATGSRIGMGEAQTVTVHFAAPTIRTADITLDLVAWGRYGITLDHAGISEPVLQAKGERFRSLVQQYQAANGQGLSIGPITNALYDLIISSWFFSVDQISEFFGKSFRVRYARYPSLSFTYPDFTASLVFGIPNRIAPGSFFLDVARQLQVVTALNGDTSSETGFNIATGFESSKLEGTVLGRLLSNRATPLPEISAVSALRSASAQGIPIHAIDAGRIGAVLPTIADSFPKNAISDAVNAGRVVIIPQRPPLINGAPVSGYITLDLQSGDGAYLVGRAGGGSTKPCDPPLSPPGEALCDFIFGYLDVMEAINSIIVFVAVLVLACLLVIAAWEALLAAAAAAVVSIVTIIALAVAIFAAHIMLFFVMANAHCYVFCFVNAGPVCDPPSSSLGCQEYLLRMTLFGVGLDEILDALGL